jgi:hypothetical protein
MQQQLELQQAWQCREFHRLTMRCTMILMMHAVNTAAAAAAAAALKETIVMTMVSGCRTSTQALPRQQQLQASLQQLLQPATPSAGSCGSTSTSITAASDPVGFHSI